MGGATVKGGGDIVGGGGVRVRVEGKVRVKELEAMGREQERAGGYRGWGWGRQIGGKMGSGDRQTKRGKRNRIKVIGDARGRKGKQRDKHSTQACECD